jgi:hypothetical protein
MKKTPQLIAILLLSVPSLSAHLSYAQSAQLDVPQGDVVMTYSEFESESYSDVMSGLVEISPTLDISYKANIDCLVNNEAHDVQDKQTMQVAFSKQDYDTLLKEADKEAEIAAMETGFFYPAYNDTLHDHVADSAQKSAINKQDKINQINMMFSNMMTSVMLYQHKDSHCKVDEFEAHLVSKNTQS